GRGPRRGARRGAGHPPPPASRIAVRASSPSPLRLPDRALEVRSIERHHPGDGGREPDDRQHHPGLHGVRREESSDGDEPASHDDQEPDESHQRPPSCCDAACAMALETWESVDWDVPRSLMVRNPPNAPAMSRKPRSATGRPRATRPAGPKVNPTMNMNRYQPCADVAPMGSSLLSR